MTTPSSKTVFQKSDKRGAESTHKPARRRQTVANPRAGIFLPQFRCTRPEFSNFLPIRIDMGTDGQSGLGLRFALCHNKGALEVKLQHRSPAQAVEYQRRDRRSE
jgi:hypothetical protein